MADEPIRTDPSDAAPAGRTQIPRTKTPLYEAYHAQRYHRQTLIREIQELTGRQLISYIGGALTAIERSDTLGFGDLLHHVVTGDDLDLLLHTGGGDIDAAEKLITMVRSTVRGAHLRVIVPDHAKSAGTLMALGADSIVMSDSYELGPIDPQVPFADANGNRLLHSVFTYLDAYDHYSAALRVNPNDAVAQLMLSKMEPQTVMLLQSVRDRARTLAENLLKQGMLQGGNWTQAATSPKISAFTRPGPVCVS